MPSSGSGTGTPVSVSTGPSIAQPFPRTWLSLHRYAKIVGIHPVHFWGAVGQTVWPLSGNSCSEVWPRYPWQYGGQLSLSELAYAIKDAEDTISNYVGYPLAPTFIYDERHRYPKFYNKNYMSLGGYDYMESSRSVNTKWKKVIATGRRSVTAIQTGANVVYTDEDGDGFSETATVTVTTSVDPCEIKVYQPGTGADPRWEIREANSKSSSSGMVTMVFDSWLFIDPDLQASMPTSDGYTAIDVTTTANYVTEVDVYREYVDTTQASSQFSWLCDACGVTNCTVCGPTNQTGCLLVRDEAIGAVVPSPATYSSGWTKAAWTKSTSPEYVSVWYQAGDVSDEYDRGETCDPLSQFWAMQITMLATARLYKPFCQCGNVTAYAKELQVELTRQGDEGGHLFDFTAIVNPFGTRKGEFMVYRNIAQGGGKRMGLGASVR